MDNLTHEQLVAACANVGVDLTCGHCAAIFFTGMGASGHEPFCRTNDHERLVTNERHWKDAVSNDHEALTEIEARTDAVLIEMDRLRDCLKIRRKQGELTTTTDPNALAIDVVRNCTHHVPGLTPAQSMGANARACVECVAAAIGIDFLVRARAKMKARAEDCLAVGDDDLLDVLYRMPYKVDETWMVDKPDAALSEKMGYPCFEATIIK